jgi:hypothetical protein
LEREINIPQRRWLRMFVKGGERYGPYPKKKAKKQVHSKEGKLLKRSYDWLKWKVADLGDFSFHRPCLDH